MRNGDGLTQVINLDALPKVLLAKLSLTRIAILSTGIFLEFP
jgi:hypothetical protein